MMLLSLRTIVWNCASQFLHAIISCNKNMSLCQQQWHWMSSNSAVNFTMPYHHQPPRYTLLCASHDPRCRICETTNDTTTSEQWNIMINNAPGKETYCLCHPQQQKHQLQLETTVKCNISLLFCTVLLRGDRGHRGWCDSPRSVLRPSYEAQPIALNPQCVLFLVCWVGGVLHFPMQHIIQHTNHFKDTQKKL